MKRGTFRSDTQVLSLAAAEWHGRLKEREADNSALARDSYMNYSIDGNDFYYWMSHETFHRFIGCVGERDDLESVPVGEIRNDHNISSGKPLTWDS
jgi:hypothetical protein